MIKKVGDYYPVLLQVGQLSGLPRLVKSPGFAVGLIGLISLIGLIGKPGEARAALTKQLPISARLLTQNYDNVPDGNYSLTFRLYNVSTGGTAVWTETQTVNAKRGVFAAQLGEVTALSGVDFNSSDLYLGIQVGTDSEMTPRKRVLPTSTALNADTLQGLSPGTGANNLLQLDSSGRITANTLQPAAGTLTLTGGLSISGNITGSSGNITVANSVIPSAGGINLGSSTNKFATGYFDNLNVGATDISGTTSQYFSVNTDQTTNNTENEGVRFYLGPTLNTYATLQWTAGSNRFDLYSRESTSTYSALRLSSLDLTATSNQLVLQAAGVTGTITWTPTSTNKVLTIPDATTTLVGTDVTQTLTNKTLTSPTISTIVNTGTLTLPTATDTLVGRATTDTLTNKTLTSPTIQGTVSAGTGLTLPSFTAGGTISAASGLTIQPITSDLSSGDALTINTGAGIELTASSGTQNFLNIAPLVNQSGTAGYTGLLVNATETATGSGTKRLLDLQVGGTTRFNIDNAGVLRSAASTPIDVSIDANDVAGLRVGRTVTTFGDQGIISFIPRTAQAIPTIEGNAALWLRSTGTDVHIVSANNPNTTSGEVIIGTDYQGSPGASNARSDAFLTIGAYLTRLLPQARSSGSPSLFTITGPAHTTLAASTEASDINFNLARTVQFATGALTTQRAVRIQAPTYGFVAASTITDAATVEISGAPVAGTNATITNPYALWITGGTTRFGGHIRSSQTTAPTIGTPTACGTSPTSSVASGSTDTAGSFTITAGTGTPGNCAVVITFNSAYITAPKAIILTPSTSTGGAKDAYVSATSTTTFTVTLATAPAASEANTWYYWVIE